MCAYVYVMYILCIFARLTERSVIQLQTYFLTDFSNFVRPCNDAVTIPRLN